MPENLSSWSRVLPYGQNDTTKLIVAFRNFANAPGNSCKGLKIMSYQPVDFALDPLNADLNHICHLLVLLGAHPIFHISRIRVIETAVLCKRN
jgi:hypothetical protein